ncbi:uncharacterized protein [Rutidosis leptorrhynchoides]|uniref:uncharacterized protein n=1 Tax=Rutidosis leptorrhynchoides TaxID=125765 RepID=UPI003A99765C
MGVPKRSKSIKSSKSKDIGVSVGGSINNVEFKEFGEDIGLQWPNPQLCSKGCDRKLGGMLVIWDNNRFKAHSVVSGDFFLAIRGNWVGFGHDSIIVNVYGPHCDARKKKMWEDLEKLVAGVDSGWVLCGNFNEVRDQTDRLNCVFHEARARKFNEFIIRNNLIEIPINGWKFTRISDDGTKFRKLDRFLVSDKFINYWNDLSINVLDRMESDHCPLILRDGVVDFGPKPFKIFDEWLNREGVD